MPIVNIVIVLKESSKDKLPSYIDRERYKVPIDNLRVCKPVPLGVASGVGRIKPNYNRSARIKSNPTKIPSSFFSDIWNSPVGRIFVPDKVSFSLSSSITAFLGESTDISFHFITKGHVASLIPYPTFTAGAQAGPQVSADALIGISTGYYWVKDLRDLKPGEAKKGLSGWNTYSSVDAGFGLGGSITGSVGFSKKPFVSRPTWIEVGISGGASIGGGGTVGAGYSFPISKK